MSFSFFFFASLILISATAAMTLRKLVHCALCLALSFAGLAAIYLQLNAQFVGFAQVLVYIGAVAILIVFAVLLTTGEEPASQPVFSSSWLVGVGVAVGVFGLLSALILKSKIWPADPGVVPTVTVRQIGDQLMSKWILPLEVLGLLLTAALIGAVVLALNERKPE